MKKVLVICIPMMLAILVAAHYVIHYADAHAEKIKIDRLGNGCFVVTGVERRMDSILVQFTKTGNDCFGRAEWWTQAISADGTVINEVWTRCPELKNAGDKGECSLGLVDDYRTARIRVGPAGGAE